MSIREVIEWHDVGEQLPDTDRDVLIQTTDKVTPVWPGFYDADGWCNADGSTPNGEVIRWAEMPKGEATL